MHEWIPGLAVVWAVALGAGCGGDVTIDGDGGAGGTSAASGTATSTGVSGGSGCVTDLATDPQSCGWCGHDCLGGACADGVCQAFALVQDSGQPAEIALTATHVVWTNYDGRVQKVSKKGGSPELLAANISNLAVLSVQDDQVYWAAYNGDAVFSVPVAGGEVTALTPGTTGGFALATDADYLYWAAFPAGKWPPDHGAVVRSARSGGAASVSLGWDQNLPFSIAVDATYVYWADRTDEEKSAAVGGVRRSKIDGGPVETLFSSHGLQDITLDADHVYAIFEGTEMGSWNDGTVVRVLKTGGPVETLATSVSGGARLAVDAENVYFTEAWGFAVRRVSKGGGLVTAVADQIVGNPQGLAVDADAVYWADPGNGKIMCAAK